MTAYCILGGADTILEGSRPLQTGIESTGNVHVIERRATDTDLKGLYK
jgi:hypothetical protein